MARWNIDEFEADLSALAARNRRQVYYIYALALWGLVGWLV